MLSKRVSHVALLCITILFIVLLVEYQVPPLWDTTNQGYQSGDANYKRPHLLVKRDMPSNCSIIVLPKNVTDSVQKFLFFVGHGRSGHSIIGSILDAHPHIVISHEYSLFHEWSTTSKQDMNRGHLYSAIYNNSCYNARSGLRRQDAMKKGYTLHISNSWQGRYNNSIEIIGDKSGGMTTKMFKNHKKKVIQAFHEILAVIKVPILVIHAVRNPFDNIATMLLYKDHVRQSSSHTEQEYANIKGLRKQIVSYFNQVHSVVRMIKQLQLHVIEVHNSDLIYRPMRTIRRLCHRLKIECSKSYIRQCSRAVFKDVSRSRFSVKWTPKLIELVEKKSKKYSFLKSYSFYD